MLSYLLTTREEPTTVGRAIEAIIHQKFTPPLSPPYEGGVRVGLEWELLVCAPDEPTLQAARNTAAEYPGHPISIIKDPGIGKPAALNMLFQRAQGDILILTDGDVWLDEFATEKLLSTFELLPTTHYPLPTKIGLVSGHPIPTNPRNMLLGFWAHVLTASADYKRKKLFSQGKYLDASGYLLAVQKHLATKTLGNQNTDNDLFVPTNILVDDSYLSHLVHQHGYSIAYAPDAIVNVKFPTTFSDWVKQKIRSTGGYLQIHSFFPSHAQMRHFWQEASEFFIPLKFVTTPKESVWLLLLYTARLYLWLRIVIFYKLLRKSYLSGWPRIESTKS